MVKKFCLIPISLYSGSGQTIGMASKALLPEVDEDLSISGLLAGRRSKQSQPSLARWPEERRIGV